MATKTIVVDTSCKWVKPILISKYEVKLIETGEISEETARQILAHNKAFKNNCVKK